eukprot:22666-Pelagomonas_calceolata.AAC.3
MFCHTLGPSSALLYCQLQRLLHFFPPGEMVLRFQPLGAHIAHTFVDWQGNSKRPGDAALRASVFDPASGWGMFATLPCAKRISGALAQAFRHGGLLGAIEWEPKASLLDISSTLHRHKERLLQCFLNVFPHP